MLGPAGGGNIVRTLENLYLSMHSGIAAMVASMVPPDDVDDIVQETYIRLTRVVASQEIRHPRAYIYRIARNLALDSLKKGGDTVAVEWNEDTDYAATVGDLTADAIDSRKALDRFYEAVQSLPPRARQAFILKKVYGYSQREIAARLEIAESTVEKHVALAMRRCADQMAKTEQVVEAA